MVVRALGKKLTENLSQPIIIENRSGGDTIPGTAAIAQASPDGYTIGVITPPEVIERLNCEINAALKSEEMIELLKKMGLERGGG